MNTPDYKRIHAWEKKYEKCSGRSAEGRREKLKERVVVEGKTLEKEGVAVETEEKIKTDVDVVEEGNEVGKEVKVTQEEENIEDKQEEVCVLISESIVFVCWIFLMICLLLVEPILIHIY